MYCFRRRGFLTRSKFIMNSWIMNKGKGRELRSSNGFYSHRSMCQSFLCSSFLCIILSFLVLSHEASFLHSPSSLPHAWASFSRKSGAPWFSPHSSGSSLPPRPGGILCEGSLVTGRCLSNCIPGPEERRESVFPLCPYPELALP